VANGELARDLNTRAIRKVFINPVEALKAAKASKWIPYARAADIVETTVTKRAEPKYQTKRIRHSTDDTHYNNTQDNSNEQTKSYMTALSGSSAIAEQLKENDNNHKLEIESLKSQVLSLQGTVTKVQTEMKTNMVKINKTMESNNKTLKEAITIELNGNIKEQLENNNDTLTMLILSLKEDIKNNNASSTKLINDISAKVDTTNLENTIMFETIHKKKSTKNRKKTSELLRDFENSESEMDTSNGISFEYETNNENIEPNTKYDYSSTQQLGNKQDNLYRASTTVEQRQSN
jgi:hypothetical protein